MASSLRGSPATFSSSARVAARAARAGAIEAPFGPGDQVLEVVDLAGERDGALALAFQRLFNLGLLFLPFFHQEAYALTFFRERSEVVTLPVAVFGDVLAQADQFAQVDHQSLRFAAHFRQHGTQHHGGAHRQQGVLRPDHQRGRRTASDSLQRREHFSDDSTPPLQRAANCALLLVEPLEAHFHRRQPALHGTHARRRFDQGRVELAAVLAHSFDLEPQLAFRFGRLPLLQAGGVEFQVALLEGVDRGLQGIDRRRLAQVPATAMTGRLKRKAEPARHAQADRIGGTRLRHHHCFQGIGQSRNSKMGNLMSMLLRHKGASFVAIRESGPKSNCSIPGDKRVQSQARW